MLLDADWNEQVALQDHRTRVENRALIGLCGTPKHQGAFLLTTAPKGADLLIGPGDFYVYGMLCELDPERLVVSSFSATQILVPSLLFDGRPLSDGQWLEITAAEKITPLYTQITAIDATSLVITLSDSIVPYLTAGTLWARRAVTYATQPFFPTPDFTIASPANSLDPVQLEDGDYIAFLRAKKREVNALEDPHIREVALGGPDTCVREQIIWQVGLKPISTLGSPPSSLPDCNAEFPEWDSLIAPMTGQMNARTVPPPPNQNPCALPPQAGYQSLDNQLYRVEIFQGGPSVAQSTFVWSRDNGSVETRITEVDETLLTVTDLGKDDVHSFAIGQWVEIVDPLGDLNGSPRFLARIIEPPDPNALTVKLSSSASAYAGRTDLRLRRWDMAGPSVSNQGIPMQLGWLVLENGIQVKFSEGSYSSHAHWEIPARTATGEIEWPPFEIPNEHPIPQPPLGDQWRYCRLAMIEVRGGVWAVYDCRAKFPPLTNICADDVCYESACDDLKSAKTVQQALDEICHERDLRFHNKHLHGWGVVCGLEVVCGPDGPSGPREHVTVKSGYAIDCNGNDVILDNDVSLNLFDMLPASPPGTVPADGDYSLTLNSSGGEQFTAAPYTPPSMATTLFNDSLLLDFYNNCIKSVVDVFAGAFSNVPGQQGQPNSLISPAQQRFDAFINILAQFANADTNSYIYISGFQPNPTPPTEDFILRDFYNKLRAKLQSDTFCAMFDKARPFPSYPFPNLSISSIYGAGFRAKLRVDPTGTRLYTFGPDENIYVYNISTNQIDSIIQFPAAGSQVQDLAFSSNGTQMYAVATVNDQETIFAVANISGFTHTWVTPTTIICDVLITTLSMLDSDSQNVYALGRGRGIFKISISAPSATPPPVGTEFCAFSQMVIDSSSGFAYSTFSSTTTVGTVPANFDNVRSVNLLNPGTNELVYPLPQVGDADDAIAIVPSNTVSGGRLFVTVPKAANSPQQILSFNATATAVMQTVDIGESVHTVVRLAHNPVTNVMMISCEDSNRVRIVSQDGTSAALIDCPNNNCFAFPTEYLPTDLTYNARANRVFILNFAANTVSVVPPNMFQVSQQIDLNALLNYRLGVIDAFLDLFAGFLQYLKDCFCEQLLVKCPSCDDDDQLVLGTVSIRSGQISKICNFTRRKYVKSFPTVGYWLSIIPILPILHMIVEKVCCAALPEFFGSRKAPEPSAAVISHPTKAPYTSKFTGKHVQGAIFAAKSFSPMKSLKNAFTKTSFTKNLLGNFFLSKVQPPAPPAAAVDTRTVLGQPADAAKQTLRKANIAVDSVPADSADLRGNLAQFLSTPSRVASGTSATLITDHTGSVIGVIPASKEAQALRSSLTATQQQVSDAGNQLKQVSQQSDALKTRLDADDQIIAANKTAIDGMAAMRDKLTSLQTQIDSIQISHAADLAARDAQIAALKSSLEQAHTKLGKQVRDLASKIRKG
jgi:hypothetical protein